MGTHLVFVYGGVGTRGIEMSRAVLSGFAFIHNAIGVLANSVHWFLADDPKQPMPQQHGFTRGSLRKQLEDELAEAKKRGNGSNISAEAHIVAYLADDKSCVWNDSSNKRLGWTSETVLDHIKKLGNGGKDAVVVILAGHGSKDGTIAIDCNGSALERSINGAGLCGAAKSCRDLLVVIAACHSEATLGSVEMPANLVGVASVVKGDTDDHGHLKRYLVTLGWTLWNVITDFPARCRVKTGEFGAWIQAELKENLGELKRDLRAKRYGSFQQASAIEEAIPTGPVTAIVQYHKSAASRRMMAIFDVRAEELATLQEELLQRAH